MQVADHVARDFLPIPDHSTHVVRVEDLAHYVADLMPLADHRNIDAGLTMDIVATVRANQDELFADSVVVQSAPHALAPPVQRLAASG